MSRPQPVVWEGVEYSSMTQLSRFLGHGDNFLTERVRRRGMTLEEAINKPKQKNHIEPVNNTDSCLYLVTMRIWDETIKRQGREAQPDADTGGNLGRGCEGLRFCKVGVHGGEWV